MHSTLPSFATVLGVAVCSHVVAGGTNSFQGLGDLPGGDTSSWENAVSADGTVVVGVSSSSAAPGLVEAFQWTSVGGMLPLGMLGDSLGSEAYAVSADGDVIVGWGTTASGREAFVWTPAGQLRNLRSILIDDLGLTDLQDWILTEATGISGDGTVLVGRGVNPNEDDEGWIAFIPVLLCEGDVNLDCLVDVNDISAVLFRLGLEPGDFGYESSADTNGDAVIDVNDICFVLFRLGDSCL